MVGYCNMKKYLKWKSELLFYSRSGSSGSGKRFGVGLGGGVG